MPLFPQGEIFHSTSNSKFSYSPSATISPPSATCQFPSAFCFESSINAPSLTIHPVPIVVLLKLCHPVVDFPSNNNFQPSDDSAAVSVLSKTPGMGVVFTRSFAGILFIVYHASVDQS